MAGQLLPNSSYFYLQVHRLGSDVVVTASGEIDVTAVHDIAVTYAAHATSSTRRIVVDASAVTFVDVAGIRALFTVPPWRGDDLEIVVRAPSPAVERTLDVVGQYGIVGAPRVDLGTNGWRPTAVGRPDERP